MDLTPRQKARFLGIVLHLKGTARYRQGAGLGGK